VYGTALVHPLASEFFPRLPGVTVEEGPPDSHRRRAWIVGIADGENARLLQGLFARSGSSRWFMFRVPETGEAVVARFETDHLPTVGKGAATRAGPVTVRQVLD
jgi:hypothetical protein